MQIDAPGRLPHLVSTKSRRTALFLYLISIYFTLFTHCLALISPSISALSTQYSRFISRTMFPRSRVTHHPPPIIFVGGLSPEHPMITSQRQLPQSSVVSPVTPVKPAVEKAPNEGSPLHFTTAHLHYLCAAAQRMHSWLSTTSKYRTESTPSFLPRISPSGVIEFRYFCNSSSSIGRPTVEALLSTSRNWHCATRDVALLHAPAAAAAPAPSWAAPPF